MKLDYASLRDEYAHLWETMEVRPNKRGHVEVTAKKILSYREIYEQVEAATRVPWYVVGIIHAMESGCNFKTHLHNGDPLTAKTRRVPKGRPLKGKAPFSWHESACDALQMKNLHKIKDWPIERICWELERYNGWGYRRYHSDTLSPYLWSYTTHYVRGKYVADGKWSPVAVSAQSGAIAVLAVLMDLCPDVKPQLEGVVIEVEEKEFPKAEGPIAELKPEDIESRTIKDAKTLEKVGVGVGVGTGVGKIVDEAMSPDVPPMPPPSDIDITQVSEQVSLVQQLMEGVHAVSKLVLANLWISGIVVGIVAVIFGRRIVRWYMEDARDGKRDVSLKD